MVIGRAGGWISKMCAEEEISSPFFDTPQEVDYKLSRGFTKEAGSGVTVYNKKTVFPAHHYLELCESEGGVRFRLKVRTIDRVLVLLFVVAGFAAVCVGLAMVVSSLLGIASGDHYAVGGFVMTCVGFFMFCFVIGLYRFLRWGAGFAKPITLLQSFGVR